MSVTLLGLYMLRDGKIFLVKCAPVPGQIYQAWIVAKQAHVSAMGQVRHAYTVGDDLSSGRARSPGAMRDLISCSSSSLYF